MKRRTRIHVVMSLIGMMCLGFMYTAQATDITPWRRLMVMFDEKGHIHVSKKIDVIVTDFAQALLEQCSPIIASSSIVYAYLKAKIHFLNNSKISPVIKQLSKAKTLARKHKINAAQSAFESVHETLAASFGYKYDPYILTPYQTPLYKEDWFVYTNLSHTLVVCIPRHYVKTILGQNPSQLSAQQLSVLGFDHTSLIPQSLPSKHNFKKAHSTSYTHLIAILNNEKPSAIIQELQKLITYAGSNAQTGEYPYVWNIYATGHSSNNGNYMNGLYKYNFHALLKVLNHHIKTNIFYYETCFSGGIRFLETYRAVETKLTNALNYILISAATSTAIHASYPSLQFTHNTFDFKSKNFGPFFTALEQGMSLEKSLKPLHPVFVGKDESAAIPLIRFPNADWFNIANLFKEVISLTKPVIMNYLIDHQGTLHVPDHIKTVIVPLSQPDLTQTIIPGTIDFAQTLPALTSMPSLSYFEHIHVYDIQSFILNVSEQLNALEANTLIAIEKTTFDKQTVTITYNEQNITSDFLINNTIVLEKLLLDSNPDKDTLPAVWYPQRKRFYALIIDPTTETLKLKDDYRTLELKYFQKFQGLADEMKANATALQKALQQKLEQLKNGAQRVSSISQHESFLLIQHQSYTCMQYSSLARCKCL